MTIAELLLPEFDEEVAKTRKVLALVPNDRLDFKPHAKSMTMGRLAGHVAELPKWASHAILTELLDVQPGMQGLVATSAEQAVASLDEYAAAAHSAIAGATDEDLAKSWSLLYRGSPVFSLPRHRVVRAMVMNHLVHHRAQLGVYLRLNDIECPGMYGPSADEAKFFEKASS